MGQIKQFRRLLRQVHYLGIDSNIFIYAFEQHPQFEPLCSVIFDLLSTTKIQLVTSTITVSEILVQPYQKNNLAVAQLYEQLFSTLPNFSLIDITYPIAKNAAKLRSKYSITLPDALQVSTSITQKASLFITNDLKLKRIKELRIICLKDYV